MDGVGGGVREVGVTVHTLSEYRGGFAEGLCEGGL